MTSESPVPPPGRVFTPDAYAEQLWALAYKAAGSPPAPRVVDPAAGEGALGAAVLRATPGAELSLVELGGDLVERLQSQFGAQARVVHADALTLARGAQAPPSLLGERFGARSPAQVHELQPQLLEQGWADIVIANPPYLRESGSRELFRSLRSWNQGVLASLYRKDTDLHVFFWELAMRWLRPGGVLAFLTPAAFLEAQAATPLRDQLLAQGELLHLWRAGAEQVFPDAGVEAAITIWRKGGGPTRRFSPGEPWRLGQAPAFAALHAEMTTLGALYKIVEGVSTAANRLRRQDVPLVPGAAAGEGILLLRAAEAAALQADPGSRSFLRRRQRFFGGAEEWILLVRDGELPALDELAALEGRTAIERHLLRFRTVLERRAEMVRSPGRSWYAVAWPRPELSTQGALVTPKWALRPSFCIPDDTAVPMTDARILVPKSAAVAVARDRILAWLQGPEVAEWASWGLKSKGAILEFYGRGLAEIPVPLGLVDSNRDQGG